MPTGEGYSEPPSDSDAPGGDGENGDDDENGYTDKKCKKLATCLQTN